MLTQADIKSRFTYQLDGTLVRRHSVAGNGNTAGKTIGHYPSAPQGRSHRHATTKIQGKTYKIHRLVYLYHHGDVPDQLDHINGDPLDNRIENLRPCDSCQNAANRRMFKSNSSGHKGVSWHVHSKRWFAYADSGKTRTNLGYFDTLEQANQAAQAAREKLHGNFAKHA